MTTTCTQCLVAKPAVHQKPYLCFPHEFLHDHVSSIAAANLHILLLIQRLWQFLLCLLLLLLLLLLGRQDLHLLGRWGLGCCCCCCFLLQHVAKSCGKHCCRSCKTRERDTPNHTHALQLARSQTHTHTHTHTQTMHTHVHTQPFTHMHTQNAHPHSQSLANTYSQVSHTCSHKRTQVNHDICIQSNSFDLQILRQKEKSISTRQAHITTISNIYGACLCLCAVLVQDPGNRVFFFLFCRT